MTQNPVWLDKLEDHDYDAAASFLTLVIAESRAKQLAGHLKSAEMTSFKAKDILRASRLPHLPEDNIHVAHDLKKVSEKKPLSPILLVRGNAELGHPLIIADGYHRSCAALHLDENVDVPCKIVDL